MRRIYKFNEIGSTQEKAKLLAQQGVPEGTVVLAQKQTGGKGRFRRKWESPRGGLWFSLVLYPDISPSEAPKITMIAGVAVAEAKNK